LLGAETFNLFGLHKREVLSWVPADTKVSVTDNAYPALKRDSLTLNLRCTALRACEDPFNEHLLLLTPNVIGNRRAAPTLAKQKP